MKSHKPEIPMTGPGHGGRVGTTGSGLLTQYLLKVQILGNFFGFWIRGISDTVLKSSSCCCVCLQQGGMIKETWMEEDPREAILKYAEVAVKDPKFIAPAYSQTQPKTIFAKSDDEEEEGDTKK